MNVMASERMVDTPRSKLLGLVARSERRNGWLAYLDGKQLPGWFKSAKTAQAAVRKAATERTLRLAK